MVLTLSEGSFLKLRIREYQQDKGVIWVDVIHDLASVTPKIQNDLIVGTKFMSFKDHAIEETFFTNLHCNILALREHHIGEDLVQPPAIGYLLFETEALESWIRM